MVSGRSAPLYDGLLGQALQEAATVAPVLVLLNTEQAAVASRAGIVVATGTGRFGRAGSTVVTGAVSPVGLTVVVS